MGRALAEQQFRDVEQREYPWIICARRKVAQCIDAERAVKSRLEEKRAMTERPELRSAFISLHVAQQYAEKNIRDPGDRDLFVTRI
ncbi:MAG: hypothetical protein IPI83_09815 [Sphingomonadales bacterium]|nr:hypothetical protein [Sphingomonadales bacterium]